MISDLVSIHYKDRVDGISISIYLFLFGMGSILLIKKSAFFYDFGIYTTLDADAHF